MIPDAFKSGILTAVVGRQYIGEIGKTDNGIVLLAGCKKTPTFLLQTKPKLALFGLKNCLSSVKHFYLF